MLQSNKSVPSFYYFLKWSPFSSRGSAVCRNPSKWTLAVPSKGEKSEKTFKLLQHAVCVKSLCYSNPSTIIKKTSTPFVPPILRYSIIKACCQWRDQDRPSLAEVSRKLASAEKSASDKVLKVPTTVNIEQYLQEAGYGEANSYTVFWPSCFWPKLFALHSLQQCTSKKETCAVKIKSHRQSELEDYTAAATWALSCYGSHDGLQMNATATCWYGCY